MADHQGNTETLTRKHPLGHALSLSISFRTRQGVQGSLPHVLLALAFVVSSSSSTTTTSICNACNRWWCRICRSCNTRGAASGHDTTGRGARGGGVAGRRGGGRFMGKGLRGGCAGSPVRVKENFSLFSQLSCVGNLSSLQPTYIQHLTPPAPLQPPAAAQPALGKTRGEGGEERHPLHEAAAYLHR